MSENGNKEIDITLQNFNLDLKLKVLMKLSGFGGMDDSVNPPNA